MLFPTPTTADQAGFSGSGLRPAYAAAWPDLADQLDRPATLPPRRSATILRLARAGIETGRPDPALASALLVAPRHRLSDGALCGAQIVQAEPQADAGPTQGAWLLRQACLEAQAWRAAAPARGDLPVTAALRQHAVHDGTLRAQTRAALAGARLPPELLQVALAAADLADAGPDVLLLVSALHDLGVGVVLDGLVRLPQGLHTLRRLPLTAVRLAASLTGDVAHSAEARALVAQAARQAHRMGTKVTVVDVHAAIQRDILADLGCDEAQGPLLSPALPPAAFRRALPGLGVGWTEH